MDDGLPPAHRLRVFVSSKTRLKDDRAMAERAIRDLQMEPVRVEMDRWLATTAREEWLAALAGCDLMLLLLAEGEPADEEYYRYIDDEIDLAERQGKPVLLFRRAAEEAPGEFVERVSRRRFARRYDTTVELGDAVRASVLAEVYGRFRRRSQAVADREAFYVQAAELVEHAERRVLLGALNPVVFFGPRKGRRFEDGFYAAMMRWVETLTGDAASGTDPRECVVFFSAADTLAELDRVGRLYDPDAIRTNLRRLDAVQRAGGQLHLVATPGPHTFAVFDDTYMMWLRAGAEWFGVRDQSGPVCDRLVEQVRRWTEEDLARSAGTAMGGTEAARWLVRFEEVWAAGGGV